MEELNDDEKGRQKRRKSGERVERTRKTTRLKKSREKEN